MVIEIDFQSGEALYTQLMNQIILGIATSRLQEGDPLPSVRQLADTIGINMHTVNKAYSLLRQEGFVSIDRRKGAVICLDVDKIRATEELKQNLKIALARGCCNNVTREEVHSLIDEILDEYGSKEEQLIYAAINSRSRLRMHWPWRKPQLLTLSLAISAQSIFSWGF